MDKTLCPECNSENLKNARYCAACGHTLPKVGYTVSAIAGGNSGQSVQLVYTPPPGRSKHVVLALVIALLAIVVIGTLIYARVKVVQSLLAKSETMASAAAPTADISSILIETANTINASCPIMIDDYTRLDNVSAQPTGSLTYHYTLVKSGKDEVDVAKLEEAIRPSVVENIKTNPIMSAIRSNNVSMIYEYYDKDGALVHKFSVNAADYQ